MNGRETVREPSPGDLDAYLGLSADEVVRLVRCLLIEEMLTRRLAAFRQDPAPQPLQRLEEFDVRGPNVVLVGHPLR